MRHECGVFGVYGRGLDVARLAYFGLFTLQHRGQESAGIAVSDGSDLVIHKQMGLVSQIFDEATLSRLSGHLAIGHVRYSTNGTSVLRNAQPILLGDHDTSLALAHNGNLVNAAELRRELERGGVRFYSTSDSECIARLLHRELAFGATPEDAMTTVMSRIQGAYSLAVMTENEVIAAKDPYGLHPLCLGRLDGGGYVIASETCALNVVGAELVREIEPGEVCIIDDDGVRWHQAARSPREAMCVFESIYFARPDSYLYGRSLHETRRRMGEVLAREHPVDADVVIAVPDTGTPGAIGFATGNHLPFDVGLVKSRYIQRTFIQPGQRQRELGASLKYTAITESLAGKRVVVVDDSIVRGTTTRKLVGMIRAAGASEIHLRIFSPPVRWPCFYGIDMASREQLIAAIHSVDEIEAMLEVDSLGFLSVDGLVEALGVAANRFCMACLTGDYPIPVPRAMREAKRTESLQNSVPSEEDEVRVPVTVAVAGLTSAGLE